MRDRVCLLVVVTALLLGATGTAFAHKLRVFATVVGNKIEGRVYFVGGGPAHDVPVALYNGAGELVSTTRTDSPKGTFALPVDLGETYLVTADTQDGHAAAFLVKPTGTSLTLAAASASPPMQAADTSQPALPAGALPAPDAALLVDEAVARQLAPLRGEIDLLRETLAMRDILGSAGIILGFFGVWTLLSTRRRLS